MSIHEEVITSLRKAHDLMPTEDASEMYELESKMRSQIRQLKDLIRPLLHAKMALQTSMEKLEKRRLGIEYMWKLQFDEIERVAEAKRKANRGKSQKKASKSSDSDLNTLVSNLTSDQAAVLLAVLKEHAK